MEQLNTALSLVPFVTFLKRKIAERDNVRTAFFQYILERVQAHPGWDGEIALEDIEKYKDIFELIYFTLSAPVTNENEDVWALGAPLSPLLFFGTNAFYDLITDKDGALKENLLNGHRRSDKAAARIKIIYTLILERFHGFTPTLKNEIIHSFRDEQTGLDKVYKIAFDTQFIDIRHEGQMPQINFAAFQADAYDEEEKLARVQKLLPLGQFRFEGFSIVHITDITADYAIENIKNIIVNLAPGQQVYHEVTHSLKTLLGNNAVNVHLFPILKVNDQLVMNSLEGMQQKLEEICSRHHFSMEAYLHTLEQFMQKPRFLFYPDLSEAGQEDEYEIIPLLRKLGIRALAVIPVFFQKKLVGILEIFSWEKQVLNPNILSTLNPVLPLLEQLLQTTIDDFDIAIDHVVKEKFTSLQPSVQWRFNEVAWQYMQRRELDKSAVIEPVFFTGVYPLYGAVDIRNSTVERNLALRNDMHCQLEQLVNTLQKIKMHHDLELLDEIVFKAVKWREQLEAYLTPEDEFLLHLFLENEAAPLLEHFKETGTELRPEMETYFSAIRPEGITFTHRRALEESLHMVTTAIGNALEQMNRDIQSTYPCYFEKFRSDGVEYDIYIGQSITPHRKFHLLYLKNIRLHQLRSMAVIARETQSLLPRMPKVLHTTQLIFIHTNTIDISFRNDEHRFDVEGAYNIRYEMVKKRIDKVHLRDSTERLTQPGKIAFVYFQQKDIEEYISYIHYLQEQGTLLDDLEYLELEELQGLSGLKALRVGVKL